MSVYARSSSVSGWLVEIVSRRAARGDEPHMDKTKHVFKVTPPFKKPLKRAIFLKKSFYCNAYKKWV